MNNPIEDLYIKTGNARIYKTMTGNDVPLKISLLRRFRVINRHHFQSVEKTRALYERFCNRKP
jgi:hypothetical protein